MKRHTAATTVCSAMSALLLLVMFTSSSRTAEPRPVTDSQHERAVPGASLQQHESRLPFVGANAPALELTRATQLRLPTRVGTRTDTPPDTEFVHAQIVARDAARSAVTVSGFIHYAAVLTHARQGLPATHNTPPPVAVS